MRISGAFRAKTRDSARELTRVDDSRIGERGRRKQLRELIKAVVPHVVREV